MKVKTNNSKIGKNTIMWSVALPVILLSPIINLASSWAEKDGKVQVLTGKIDPGRFIIYLLPNLKHGRAYTSPIWYTPEK